MRQTLTRQGDLAVEVESLGNRGACCWGQHGWTFPQPSPSLCSRSWWLERGPYSCLAMMKMGVKHIRTCHSHCVSGARASGRRQACDMNGNSTSVSQCSRLKICHCRQVEPVKPKRAYHQPSRELRSWVVDYALLDKEAVNREMLAMCSFPFCERSAAVLMQPTFDRGRATWHDAQIRHTDPPFEARWTGPRSRRS